MQSRINALTTDIVNRAGYASPVRTPRGRDIFAACGQLKSESERISKKDRDALQPHLSRYRYQEYPVGHTIHPDGLRTIPGWLTERLDEAKQRIIAQPTQPPVLSCSKAGPRRRCAPCAAPPR